MTKDKLERERDIYNAIATHLIPSEAQMILERVLSIINRYLKELPSEE